MSVKVSVVIPVFNIEQHLRQCLDSVAGQTLQELEIICVDDGSTDQSPAILAEYAAKDSRFRIVRQDNAGPGAARNRGMELATGKYLIFLDSDDWFEPEFLQCMADDAEQTGADVTICRADEFDTNTGKVYDGTWMLKTQLLPGRVFSPADVAKDVFQFTYGWPWDKLYRRAFIQKEALQFPILKNSEDLVFVFKSLLLAQRIGVYDSGFVHHRINRCISVSNQRDRYPECPYDAVKMMREFIEQREFLWKYRNSEIHWEVNFLIWHVSNLTEDAQKKTQYEMLRRNWMTQWEKKRAFRTCRDDRQTKLKYLLVRFFPYAVFCMVLNSYKKYCVKAEQRS